MVGKFEGAANHEIASALYDKMVEGFLDDETGSTSENGLWLGLILASGVPEAENVVVTEDSDGFFDYFVFPNAADAREAFRMMESAVMEGA